MLALESVRHQWEEGSRRFDEALRDPAARPRLLEQLDVVHAELRRRVGQTFTLDELAAAYEDADTWVREAIEVRAPAPGWPRTLALVQDAAFYSYQRGAVDYLP